MQPVARIARCSGVANKQVGFEFELPIRVTAFDESELRLPTARGAEAPSVLLINVDASRLSV